MLTLQELSDRVDIQDLIARYAHAIDDRDWDMLDNIFTEDAVIDYTDLGGKKGSLPETKIFLKEAMPKFSAFQHLSTTSRIDIKGDKAFCKTILFNPMVMDHEGEQRVFFIGLWYRDEMVRTTKGWRIKSRREEKSWSFNAPENMLP